MIDLHNHILPGVDDGAASLDESVEMARVAHDDGVRAIVATPHRNAWTYNAERADAERRLSEVAEACRAAGVPVELILGSEAYIAPDLANQVRDGLAFTINGGRYLLVEWPLDQHPSWSDHAIFDLQVRGICPIVAHAERYRDVQQTPVSLLRLVERGVLVQITASSLLGEAGRHAQRAAEDLLQRGLAHLLATDSHSPRHRPPVLSPARQRLAELIGEERAWAMVREVPRQIVENRVVDLPPPKPSKPRSFWAFWK